MSSQPKKDLTNQKFNMLTALEYLGESKWRCKCDCGKETIVKTSSLNSGKTQSCGCLRGQNTKNNTRNSGPKEDLTGKIFTYLTPIEYVKGGQWKCQCKCGTVVIVDTRNLKGGHTKSCGCLVKEINSINNTIDMTGFENEGVKVIERAGSDEQGTAMWKCLCKKCSRTFITKGATLRNGATRSCGCVHSWNEQEITKMLLENGCEFAVQYTFSDLKGINGGALRFDFAVFQNNELHHLIEFNGKQHYEKGHGAWSNNFETQQKNDQLKIQYCKDHNIELRIIKYDQEYSLEDLI